MQRSSNNSEQIQKILNKRSERITNDVKFHIEATTNKFITRNDRKHSRKKNSRNSIYLPINPIILKYLGFIFEIARS